MVNRRVNRVVHTSFTPFLIVSLSGDRPFRTRSLSKKRVRLFQPFSPVASLTPQALPTVSKKGAPFDRE
jgi:hypothetical protein